MACGSNEAGGAHGPRHPQQTPFYQPVEPFFPRFEGVYEERYPERYGFWRPVCTEVPQRKFVFTIPKRLRIYFRFERRLLGEGKIREELAWELPPLGTAPAQASPSPLRRTVLPNSQP